jgi:hypothetical protein
LDEIRKKKGIPKGRKKKATINVPVFCSLFPPFFARSLFGPLSPFHAVCVLLSLPKGDILEWSKRTGVNFSGFYSSLGALSANKGTLKGAKKGTKKGYYERS